MMLRILTFLFFCTLTQFLMSQNPEVLITQGSTPPWVNRCDFSVDFVPLEPSEVNIQCLLIDVQMNWEERTCFHHFALKALTQSGVSEIAEVEIDFDPSYERVIVHDMGIIRGGRYLDRLQSSRHSVLQREEKLETDVYQGELTWVHFLEDVQEGDIVEYSYSIVGVLPHFSSHFSCDYPLQATIPIHRLYRRLLIDPKHVLTMKSFNGAKEPQIIDLFPHLREWIWDIVDSSPYDLELGQPSWSDHLVHVQLTEYRTWKEVIEKILPLFNLPDDFMVNIPMDMQTLIQTWKESTIDPLERALLAVRFVQEKVRYLGFEEGLNGFKPTDPRTVFQRRYGDCKDKTLLLSTLLRLMDIDSTPVLVDTEGGVNLVNYLPSPFLFNHIVLKIDMGRECFWVDSTINYQGGSSLRENFFPEYHWGLPLSENSTDLIALPSICLKQPTEINTSIILTSEDSAELKISWTFYADKSDHVRRYIASYGLKQLSDDALQGIQKLYGKATFLSPMTYSDDRQRNISILNESYRISMQKRSENVLKIYSFVIKNYLESGLNPERLTPYALYYPAWVKEHIHVENPFHKWNQETEHCTYEHESLYFSRSKHIQDQCADFYFELKHFKDHVPLHSIHKYCEMIDEIEEHAVYLIPLSKPKGKAA